MNSHVAVTHAPLSHGPPAPSHSQLLNKQLERNFIYKKHSSSLFFAVHLFVVISESANSITNSRNIEGRESIEVTFGAPHALSLSLTLLLYDIVIYYRAESL